MTFEVTSLCKEHRHANMGTCRLHALDESVGRPACRGDVIDHQDALTTEEILVDVVALVCPVCEFVHVADMSLLTMAADDGQFFYWLYAVGYKLLHRKPKGEH